MTTDALPAPTAGGFKALGYDSNGIYVWSNARRQVHFLPNSAIHSTGPLISLVQDTWAHANFGFKHKDGTPDIHYKQLGSYIARCCDEIGPYDPARTRGPGVWTAEDDGRVLVVNSNDIWRSDGQPAERLTDKHVYAREGNLGVSPATPPATPADVKRILDLFGKWHWQRASDPKVMLGWLMLGYVAGALPWRPHLSLTGSHSTGKSSLMWLLSQLIGGAGVFSEGKTTEAGVRQEVDSAAYVLLMDEGEADQAHLADKLEYLRISSSGGNVLMGTKDHKGRRFTLRSLGCIAGIHPPRMSPQDISRFVRLILREPDKAYVETPDALMDRFSGDAARIGVKLFARAIRSWTRFLGAVKLVRGFLPGDNIRFKDALSPVIAMAWCALNDGELTETAARHFVAEFDLQDDLDRISEAAAEDDIWGYLMTRAVRTNVRGTGARMTMADLVARAAGPQGNSWGRELGIYGLKVQPAEGAENLGRWEVCINTRSTEFKQLFREHPVYSKTDLVHALRRVPGAAQKSDKTARIGGVSVRYVGVTIDLDPIDDEGNSK